MHWTRRAGESALTTLAPPRFTSLLISQGLNVVFVSRRLGHSNPNTTLQV
jgi:hypothetical protein